MRTLRTLVHKRITHGCSKCLADLLFQSKKTKSRVRKRHLINFIAFKVTFSHPNCVDLVQNYLLTLTQREGHSSIE